MGKAEYVGVDLPDGVSSICVFLRMPGCASRVNMNVEGAPRSCCAGRGCKTTDAKKDRINMAKKTLVTLCVSAMVPFCAWTYETCTVDGIAWTYSVADGNATVGTGDPDSPAIPVTTTGDIEIPATLNGCPVTRIADYAFQNCEAIESVKIPYGVTGIGSGAFSCCAKLSSVEIPASVASFGSWVFEWCGLLAEVTVPPEVESIPYGAFYQCTSLVDLTISDGVLEIAGSCFLGCSSLTNVFIPSSVTNIGGYAFGECVSLVEIAVDADNSAYASVNGMLLSKDGTQMLVCPNASMDVSIPDGVTAICESAFNGCASIEDLLIPDSVTVIADYAFFDCVSLTNLVIPACVTNIGSRVFDGCASLAGIVVDEDNATYRSLNGFLLSKDGTRLLDVPDGVVDVSVPEGVVSIGDDVFMGCDNLESVEFPDSVEDIGEYAFYDCESLSDLSLPDGLKTIGTAAFSGCKSISGVEFPDGITNIGERAFHKCRSLKSVTIPDSVVSVGRQAFSNCSSELYDTDTFPGIRLVDGWAVGSTPSLPSVLDLNGVRGVAGGTFGNCTSLECVTIPGTVSGVGVSAFYGCNSLTNVTIASEVVHIADRAFEDCEGLADGDGFVIVRGVLHCYCGEGGNISIPYGVTEIVRYAFYDRTSLESVEIPNSVMRIAEDAFTGCSSLKIVRMPERFKGAVDMDAVFDRCPEDMLVEYVDYPTTVLAAVAGGCERMGKVSGGRTVKVGESLSLKATANRGHVFAGWYRSAMGGVYADWVNVPSVHVVDSTWPAELEPCDSRSADYRNPSYSCTVGEEDLILYARFVPSAADTNLSLAVDGVPVSPDDDPLASFTVGGATNLPFVIDSLSLPKVSVKGLPAGMRFTNRPVYAKGSKTEIETPANSIYGTPTKPGVYRVSVSLTNSSIKKAVVNEFEIVVPNITCDALPHLNPDAGAYEVDAGMAFDPERVNVSPASSDWKVSVSGLPAGLRYDAKSRKISGVASKPGVYTVTFTARCGKERQVATITLNVSALPEGVVGSFSGFVVGDGLGEFNKVGTVQITTTSAGKITAKAVTAGGTCSFSKTGWDGVLDNGVGLWVLLTTKKGETFRVAIGATDDWSNDQMLGVLKLSDETEYTVTAHKVVFGQPWHFKASGSEADGWTLVPIADAKSADVTVTVRDGTTKLAGRIGGYRVTASGFVDMTALSNGVFKASFTPFVKVGKVRRALVVDAVLNFSRSDSSGRAGFGGK